MAGIERLHPHLQHAIVNELGWRSLRPVQEMTIDAVLDGCNSVVLAPTAGGKTEAAIFPLLSRILTQNLKPVSILYVCPIRALLNNQEERLESYARMVGLDVFKWHGDVSDSKKQRFRDSPAHILMTTPESLEVMFISARTDTRALFPELSAVVIDEVHAFAGDDRGAHLASLLERLGTLCGRDIQRIGLSATVGNPQLIGEWLQGSSARPFRLVDPPRPPAQRDLHVDYVSDLAEAASGIMQMARGKKSLVFVEILRDCNKYWTRLVHRRSFTTHGSNVACSRPSESHSMASSIHSRPHVESEEKTRLVATGSRWCANANSASPLIRASRHQTGAAGPSMPTSSDTPRSMRRSYLSCTND
jgi:ATP-dependent helicase Lhr and Lhr-like helicase